MSGILTKVKRADRIVKAKGMCGETPANSARICRLDGARGCDRKWRE